MGYLVEHHRVGQGDMLRIEYREGNMPSVFTEHYQRKSISVINKRVSPADAGVMIITRYTTQQAEELWEQRMLPGLSKFVAIWNRLLSDSQYREQYQACADRKQFCDSQSA